MKFTIITYLLLVSTLFSFGQMDSTTIFERSKGKWPLPLAHHIEIYNNEKLKHAYINVFDSTLRIITDSSYQVKAVHEGTIAAILEIDGEYTVLTRFGNYIIVYSKLTKPNLKDGELIKTGQLLGRLVKNESDDNYTLEIRLLKGKKELSAEKWIDW